MYVYKDLKLKIQELSNQLLSQELVAREVNQQLRDKRALFASETQRMHQLSQQQEAQVKALQTELGGLQGEMTRVQNLLASQQQNYELRLTSLTTQNNMAKQEQVRIALLVIGVKK